MSTRIGRIVILAVLVAAAAASSASAQQQPPPAGGGATAGAAAPPAAAPPAAAPPAAAPSTIEGRVTDANGAPREGAVDYRLRRDGQADQFQVADRNGQWVFRSLAAGEYQLQLMATGAVSPGETVTLAAGQTLVRPLNTPAAAVEAPWPVVGGAIVYLIVILGFRLFTIAQPARKLLNAEIQNVRLKLQMEGGSAPKPALDHLIAEIDAVDESQEWSWDEYVREPIFWSGGRELTAWRRIHEIERHMVAFMAPSERLVQRALSVESQLRACNTPTATGYADRLRETLAKGEPMSPTVLRYQLGEALGYAYNEQDNKFAGLMEWHNKAMWMVTLALLVIVSLTTMFDHSTLFLIGAVGGLMGRMMRSLHREDVPTDYGASWTTIFLSPLLGAIAAWFGIAGIDMLGDMGVLGGTLATIEWGMPAGNAMTLFIAFLLGFSERLFMSLLTTAEGQITTQLDKGSAGAGRTTLQASSSAASPATAQLPTRAPVVAPIPAPASATVIEDLDLTAGERVVFIGESMSPLRLRLLSVAGAGNVKDATLADLPMVGDADAILIEQLPEAAALPSLAGACAKVLRTDGRIVAVGVTPAGLFDADAGAQAQQNVVGPALVHAAMTAAGLLAQEPPDRLSGPDPVRWSVAYKKP